MKKKQNLTYINLREAWPCHLMLKIREITGKLLKSKQNTKFSVGIKCGKGLLTACVLDLLTSVIECR